MVDEELLLVPSCAPQRTPPEHHRAKRPTGSAAHDKGAQLPSPLTEPELVDRPLDGIVAELGVDPCMGLSFGEALARQKIHGANDVSAESPRLAARRAGAGRVMLTGPSSIMAVVVGAAGAARHRIRESAFLAKYLEQFQNPLILLLLASAAISLLMGQMENCISITLVRPRVAASHPSRRRRC